MGSSRTGASPSTLTAAPNSLTIMAESSIHFEPVAKGSEEHNKRLKFLDYVHPERTHLNEYEEKDTQAHRLAVITKNFLDHHPKRKKLHAKATPIREAVVNIEEGTTMADLKELAKRLRDRFGIDVFQIAIHKDEGYKNSNDPIKLNLHAHLVADWTDHSIGESLKLKKQDMAEMQTITAEVLGMKRGVSSDKKHLTAMQYKEKKAREEAEKAIKAKNKAEEKMAAANDRARKLSIKAADSFLMLQNKNAEFVRTSNEVKKMRSEATNLKASNNSLSATQKALKSEISELTAKKDSISAERDKVAAEAESLAKVAESTRSDIRGLEARKEGLQKEILIAHQERAAAQREVACTPRSRDLAEAEKAGNIWKDMIYGIWESARAAVNVLCRYFYYKHIDVSFDRDEVVALNNAMKSAQTMEERKAYGRDLVKLAHAEYPGYADDSTRLWEIGRKVEEVADKTNRWFQRQGQDRSQGRGY